MANQKIGYSADQPISAQKGGMAIPCQVSPQKDARAGFFHNVLLHFQHHISKNWRPINYFDLLYFWAQITNSYFTKYVFNYITSILVEVFYEFFIMAYFKKNLMKMLKAEFLQLKLIHLFARELFLMKKLEVEKNKPIFITSVEYKVVLVSSISNFFINKMSLANKWMRKKIPSFCNLALAMKTIFLFQN